LYIYFQFQLIYDNLKTIRIWAGIPLAVKAGSSSIYKNYFVAVKERKTMIYKIYVQELKDEVPVRERTKAFFVEGESEREIREKLKKTPFIIEYIQPLKDSHVEFEKQSGNFKVLEI